MTFLKTNLKKFLAFAITACMVVTMFSATVSANSYGYNNKEPYTRSWLDAINSYTVVDYYSYSVRDEGYVKSAVLNVSGSTVYNKTLDLPLTSDLKSDEYVGFGYDGSVYFITSRSEVVGFVAGSKNGDIIGSGESLEFDSNDFVIGFWNGQNYFAVSGGNLSGNTNVGNNNWPGNNNPGNNNGTNTGNNNIGNNSDNKQFPYLTVEDNKLAYIESTDAHHLLYIEDGYLCFNNIILYKNGTKMYGYSKDSVIYITNKGHLVQYKFGDKKQYVKAKNVTDIVTDMNGFIIGYTKSNGKSYSI